VRCVRAKREEAEKTRQALVKASALDGGFVPGRDEKFVYFPLKLGGKTKFATVQKKLLKREEFGKPLSLELEGKLTKREADALIGGFDIVGDIAVLEIPGELEGKEKLIASAVLKIHHNLKVVAKKTGGTAGEFRIRPVKVIAGAKRTSTIYREGGCRFELDLNKTYFSPRLGTERGRLCSLVKPGEKVLVPFAGVGPFAIRMGCAQKGAKVVGIELNPDAAKYFEENIARNKCGNVECVKGDVGKLLPGKYAGWADRAAMPLPKDASGFLANVIPCMKKRGILHYYSFGDSKNPFEAAEGQVKEAALETGRRGEIVFKRVVRPYSKSVVQVVVDARIW